MNSRWSATTRLRRRSPARTSRTTPAASRNSRRRKTCTQTMSRVSIRSVAAGVVVMVELSFLCRVADPLTMDRPTWQRLGTSLDGCAAARVYAAHMLVRVLGNVEVVVDDSVVDLGGLKQRALFVGSGGGRRACGLGRAADRPAVGRRTAGQGDDLAPGVRRQPAQEPRAGTTAPSARADPGDSAPRLRAAARRPGRGCAALRGADGRSGRHQRTTRSGPRPSSRRGWGCGAARPTAGCPRPRPRWEPKRRGWKRCDWMPWKGCGPRASAGASPQVRSVSSSGSSRCIPFVSGAGACSPWRCTAPAGRATLSPRCTAPGRTSRRSSASIPGTELRELEVAVLRQDPALEAPGPALLGRRRTSLTPTAEIVGRQREIGLAHGALDAAQHGAGRLVLVTGGPGIGKTSLARSIAAEAAARGFRVGRGAWDADEAPPLSGWHQALGEALGSAEVLHLPTTDQTDVASTTYRLGRALVARTALGRAHAARPRRRALGRLRQPAAAAPMYVLDRDAPARAGGHDAGLRRGHRPDAERHPGLAGALGSGAATAGRLGPSRRRRPGASADRCRRGRWTWPRRSATGPRATRSSSPRSSGSWWRTARSPTPPRTPGEPSPRACGTLSGNGSRSCPRGSATCS